MSLYNCINDILKQSFHNEKGLFLGKSREGRSIYGYRFGIGQKKVSLIAGNHADEPIGPLLLKKLVNFLATLNNNHELLKDYSWWIVPHTNPDGEEINKKWYSYTDKKTNLASYLKYVSRELPGEDLEFGYPIEGEIDDLRPENRAIYEFWKTAKSPFNLHVSLHGLRSSYGPWFLLDQSWIDRTVQLQNECVTRTHELGYDLYDLDRSGEKGFVRIAEGFCTRPDSKEMKKHFLNLGETEFASKFHPSSMESIRSLGGDCLTLVSEMPLFVFPKKERELVWPDEYLTSWGEVFANWTMRLINNEITTEELQQEMDDLDIKPMPWEDQIRLQWQLIVSGLTTV